ncbi:excinuclease ABC subunit UvrA [Solirubrobacter phytolaccae]|uniref:UvrABC system protein A n=1 Tax=Solirubrobacter phytolaccae TaxID=1404360 RepID=A0A9X3SAR2_9ACTN|nr:excinuclease ABC subunit UvrA [Solirubrobacter phytolaccae]MDA0184744.1 excinuclease ABC subunit UvrA [Solirubrobacter phytolaccae]
MSGSGKSSIVFDTIAAESQRLLNDTMPAFVQTYLPSYGQPDADELAELSPAIIVDQKKIGGNARSTVGTYTDAYTMLRVLFSRLSEPSAGISSRYSFNDPRGMCPECEGLGRIAAVDEDALVDPGKSLNEGAIDFPNYNVDSWYWSIIAGSGFFDPDKKVGDYTPEERHQLLYAAETKVELTFGNKTVNSKYEGLILKLKKSVLGKEPETLQRHLRAAVERIATHRACTACAGSRLNDDARASRLNGKGIAECSSLEARELAAWVRSIEAPSVAPVVNGLALRLEHLDRIGLGYLSLDRPTATLSGGESQRVRLVRHLGSALTGMTYIFDEPSIGLHPHDVHRLNELLVEIRDKGNTVLVVEHEPDVIAVADHVVDMGPGAGREGGTVVYVGDVAGLLESGTKTGEHFARHQALKTDPRTADGAIEIRGATKHNLKRLDVDIPRGVLTVVTGVAGSGKSSLIHGYVKRVEPDAVLIDQRLGSGSRRSNPATYTSILDPIRKAFAKANGVDASLFSANSKGACPDCNGLGIIYTDLAHMDPVIDVCEACEGRRFTDEVLEHTLRGASIADVYAMQADAAVEFFTEKAIKKRLQTISDVGLGYVTLGQSLSTLSGGERQRLKLANELDDKAKTLVLDEPTTGLHMHDVDRLIALIDRLVDGGATVIVIEHDLDVISRADHVIDLGPGAGHDGGTIVFQGPPHALVQHPGSLTGQHLARRQG